MKKILLPTDFSENSKNAILYGLELLKYEDVEFILLHAKVADQELNERHRIFKLSIEEEWTESIMEQLENDIRLEFKECEIELETKIQEGHDATECIVQTAKKENVNLIIMSTTGQGDLPGQAIGSIAASVVKNSDIPVMLIPNEMVFVVPTRIVFVVDFKHQISEDTLAPMVDIATTYNSELFVLQVVYNNDTVNEAVMGIKVNDYLSEIDHSYYKVNASKLVRGIEEFVLERNADILAIISFKHNLFDRIFQMNETNTLSIHRHCPLLILHGLN